MFVIKKDPNLREYAEKNVKKLTKNRRESDEAQNDGIVFATGKKMSREIFENVFRKT